LLEALGLAFRASLYSAKTDKVLVSGIIRSFIDHVAQTFRDNDENRSDNTSSLLLRKLKGYTNLDGNEVQQKAIPLSSSKNSPIISQLTTTSPLVN